MDSVRGGGVVHIAVAEPGEVRDLLRAAQSAKTDPSGQFCVDSMIAQGTCWKIVEGGVITAALLTAEEGGALWVLIASGRSCTDLVEVMAAHLQQHAAGRYSAIGFRTARKGLVRKAMRHGYEVEAFILRKKL